MIHVTGFPVTLNKMIAACVFLEPICFLFLIYLIFKKRARDNHPEKVQKDAIKTTTFSALNKKI